MTRLALPDSPVGESEGATIDDDWLDAFDAFMSNRSAGARLSAVDMVEVKDLPWTDAGRVLSTTWLALRMALDGGVAVRAWDGSIYLHLGGGLAAVIHLTKTAEECGEPLAMVQLTPTADRYGRPNVGGPLMSNIDSGVDGTSFSVPARIVVLRDRMRAEICFTASPLLFGGRAGDLAFHAARMAAIEAEAARRRAQDDDDDD